MFGKRECDPKHGERDGKIEIHIRPYKNSHTLRECTCAKMRMHWHINTNIAFWGNNWYGMASVSRID